MKVGHILQICDTILTLSCFTIPGGVGVRVREEDGGQITQAPSSGDDNRGPQARYQALGEVQTP